MNFHRLAKQIWASNLQGPEHKNKTACTSSVVDHFGCLNNTRYLHTMEDVVRSVRKGGFKVRSRKSQIKKNATVGSIRKQLKSIGDGKFIVRVNGHVLLMNDDGNTIVDTDPRKRDRRKITHLYIVQPEV